MKYYLQLLGCCLISVTFLPSCNKPSLIGSDLLLEDQLDVGFSDTFQLTAYSTLGDSVRTYDPEPNNQLNGYLCGRFEDPIMGFSTALMTFQYRLDLDPPDFENAQLDSMVLVLPYYPSRVYGNLDDVYGLAVYPLLDDLSDTLEYYSNDKFLRDALVGSAYFRPAPSDSVTILRHGGDPGETQTLSPQVRIRLKDDFALALMAEDSATLATDSAFLTKYKGFQVAPATLTPGMLSFGLRNTEAELLVYYRQDTLFRQYSFEIHTGAARISTFEHDYSGSIFEPFLQDKTLGDSLVFVQGMTGVSAVFEISVGPEWADRIVNRAELELSIAVLPEDGAPEEYLPLEQLIVSAVQEDGSLEAIDDVLYGISAGDLDGIFGGVVEPGTPQRYVLNLSAYFKELRRGNESPKIQITALTRAEQAGRVVICGPKHPDYPARLRVTYTNY